MSLLIKTICLLLLSWPMLADKWTVDDVLFAESGAQFDISRDGKLVVWVKSQMDKEKGESASNLFLRNLTENLEIQLTRGADNHSSPKFSPEIGRAHV